MTDILKKAYSSDLFRKDAHNLVDILSDFLESCQSGKEPRVLPWKAPEEHYQEWKEIFDSEFSISNLDLWRKLIAPSNRLHSPSYMGHQVGTPAPISGMADMLNGVLNNSSAVYEMGPVVTSMERVVVKWLTGALGFGENSEGIITSGGSLGNLTALLAARQNKAGYNIWKEGNRDDFNPAVIVSKEAHYSVSRSVQIMGWGEDSVIHAPVDENFALDASGLPKLFEQAKSNGKKVIAVVGNACTTSTGTYDPIDRIADFCEEHDIWFHVDGAHGGIAAISPKYQHFTEGINRADSVVIDFHKMMGVSSLATAVLFKDKETSYNNFAQDAAYILDETKEYEWYNSAKRTIECTKNMMSAKLFITLNQLGPQFFVDFLNTCYDNGQLFARIIEEHDDFELAVQPQSNIVCFRFVSPDINPDLLNKLNNRVWRDVVEKGKYYIVQTQINNKSFLRTSLMNPFTGKEEMQGLLNFVSDLIHSYHENT